MSPFRHDQQYRNKRSKKWLLISPIVVFVLAIGLVLNWYSQNIKPADRDDSTTQTITVEEGSTEDTISSILEQKGIIRSATAYRFYVRLNGEQGQMQAGGYELSSSMSVAEIVEILSEGKIAVELVTILPAQRLDQIEEAFAKAGYSEDEIAEALDPETYPSHPALVDKPQLASLEGYLYPESFQKTPTTPLSTIVELSLDETAKLLTPRLVADLKANHDLDIHQAIIMASIVEREVNNPEDRAKVAQVFLKRYKSGISLGSDPTALFGALLFGLEPSVSADTPYNTRIYAGLPPGPINNISAESLRAVAYPAGTDFLFFVSGDDGNTYFSNTQAEHEALAAQHCIELCRSY